MVKNARKFGTQRLYVDPEREAPESRNETNVGSETEVAVHCEWRRQRRGGKESCIHAERCPGVWSMEYLLMDR